MSSSTTDPQVLVDVVMPQMGVSVTEGTVIEWRKQVGDAVAADETVCEITSDKVDTDVPAPVAGLLEEILVEPGSTVAVGTVLARIAAEGQRRVAEQPEQSEPRKPATPRGCTPVVRRMAEHHRIDLTQVEGSGRGGRVRKQDVLDYLARQSNNDRSPVPLHTEPPYRPPQDDPAPVPAQAQPVVYQPPEPRQLSRMRRSIGEHMKASLDTAATCTTWLEADMTGVEARRRELELTALPLVARATIETLREFPDLNAWLDGDERIVHDEVNLGIAVSLGADGLIVPVIRSAQDLSVEGLAREIRGLARRARARELSPDDVRGGTFTITNPGQYGSIMATPVINQPQVAILDLEAVVKRPVVMMGPDGEEAIAIRSMTVLGLSWDHRALDGALAAQFLAALGSRLEQRAA